MNLPQEQAAHDLFRQVKTLEGVYSVGISLCGEELHLFIKPGTVISGVPATVGRFRVVALEVDFK